MTTTRSTLTEGSVRQHLITLTVPMIWGVLAMMSFYLVDTWFVAQLGAPELAAMSFTFPVVMVLVAVGIGMMAGTSSVLARVIGENDPQRVRRLTTDASVLALILSAAFTAVGLMTIDPLFGLLGAPAELLPLIRDYMVVWYWGFVFMLVPMVGLGAIRATGDSKLQSWILIGGAVLNIILDPLLIFGLAGLPRLELQGAAIATVAARAATFVVGYWALHFRKRMLTYELPTLHELWSSWRDVMHVGLPAAGTNVIIPAATGVVVAMLADYGPNAVAAFGAATRIEQFVLVVFFAMSATIGPFVGQNLGAGEIARIGESVRLSNRFCLWLGLGLTLLLGLGGRLFMRQFSESEEVVVLGAVYLLIVPLSYGFAGVVMVVNAAFNGLGQPMPAVAISVTRMVLLMLPLAWLGGWLAGAKGIFAALCLANVLSGLAAIFWFRRACRNLFETS